LVAARRIFEPLQKFMASGKLSVKLLMLPMPKYIRYAAAFICLVTICGVFSPAVSARDIKDKVIKETILDEQISLFCQQNCVGNERKGTLKSLSIDPAGKDLYSVFGIAAFQNRQVTKDFVLFDHTVYIVSKGTLNSTNCRLKVDDAYVKNDYRNIFTNMLKSQSDVIGKVFVVPDCRRFIE